MDVDPEGGAEQSIEKGKSKDIDKRDIGSDSSEQIEDTSDDKGSEDTDERSTVPESSRYAGVRKDKESKHYDVKGPCERTCQETYLYKGMLDA